MTGMKERIARLLEPNSWAAIGLADTLMHKNRRTWSLQKAGYILDELRDPTEAMEEAGKKVVGNDRVYPDMGFNVWQAMIDAAKAE